MSIARPLGLLVEIKVFAVLILDAVTVLVSTPLLICVGFVYCHHTGSWTVWDNTHGTDSGAFC